MRGISKTLRLVRCVTTSNVVVRTPVTLRTPLVQVRFQSNGTGTGKKPTSLISEDLLAKAAQRQEAATPGSTPRPPASSTSAESSSSGLGWATAVVFLGLSSYGMYQLAQPMAGEPDWVSKLPFLSRTFRRIGAQFSMVHKRMIDPVTDQLLPDPFPPTSPAFRPYTLVLELEDVLVHSEWDKKRGWSVAKRPWVDAFLAYMCQMYEVIVFTDKGPFYASPVLDKLDRDLGTISYRLDRTHTVLDPYTNLHMKDVEMLNRDPRRVIVMECKPERVKQQENVIEVPRWKGDPNDTWLMDMLSFLQLIASGDHDVREILPHYRGTNIPLVTAKRMAENSRTEQAQRQNKADQDQTEVEGRGWLASIGRALQSFMGFQRPADTTDLKFDREFALKQAQQVEQLYEAVEENKKMRAQEMEQMEQRHKEMLAKASETRITLWEMAMKGPDEAVKEKLAPEVRQYFDELQAQSPPVPQ